MRFDVDQDVDHSGLRRQDGIFDSVCNVMRFENRNGRIHLKMKIYIDGRAHLANEDFFDAPRAVDAKCALLDRTSQRRFRHSVHRRVKNGSFYEVCHAIRVSETPGS